MTKAILKSEALRVLANNLKSEEKITFDYMAKGQKLPSTVTKAHLESIIRFLVQDRGWVGKLS